MVDGTWHRSQVWDHRGLSRSDIYYPYEGVLKAYICNEIHPNVQSKFPLEMHWWTRTLSSASLYTLTTRLIYRGATIGLKMWLRGEYSLCNADEATLQRNNIWNGVGWSVWMTILSPIYSITNVNSRMGWWFRLGRFIYWGCIGCPGVRGGFTTSWMNPRGVESGLMQNWVG